ncbi:tRNA pseudouridine(38-40) synthase TruA [Salsuginibacillus kocurii]|uniref:tRNA pseudouridine(38-40) synthase TruA n=1 Tax=Salsuginibacillus kocurii TaxID=427078 RepID=UPI0003622BD2|nr:tRNA pseudouridine(38-40) synthase TruA [Salsuginibacillus kocurii]
MKRIKATIAYDGTHFSGWQRQPAGRTSTGRTVQEEVEKALKRLHKGRFVTVHAAGRTDTGVHSIGQVIHFDTDLAIPAHKWSLAMEQYLPKDIFLSEAELVSDRFHARYDAIEKEYRYRVYRKRKRDVFRRNYTYHLYGDIDVAAMQEAAAALIGRHDFTSFSGTNTKVNSKVRTLYVAEVEEQGDELIFTFRGDGFLYNMIRILVGTLLEIGVGRKKDSIEAILAAKDRRKAGPTVPGSGLYLWEIGYEKK